MEFTLTLLGTDTQFPGWDVHLMSELPKSPAQYKNSYIFIKKNDTQELYYIKPDGEYEKAKIIDFNLFEEKINANKNKDKTKLHLIDEQIKEIVTSNGGHTPALEGYDKAETLSYISTLIPGDSSESLPTDNVTQYRNSTVAVVDGPTTLGQEVGDRIARGVQAILEAMSRGKTEINIIAHSRGAVEAILVAHELERIQKLLTTLPIDRAELTKSECKYTTAAMNGAHRDAFAQLEIDKIAPSIAKVKLSMLTIDPVPGGNYMGITRASTLAWRDPRFYRVPKIVREYEQYTYENERTRCFKCIVPKCDSPETTSFKLYSLPGHHGTGSGNLKSQQREEVPKGTTEHVQELVIVKIIDFLKRNGVTITRKTETETVKDPFKALIDQLMPINNKTLKTLYFELYNKIIENRDAYKYFNNTSYPTLGQEQALLRKIWKVVDQRIVHYQAHNDTYLDTIVPPVPGGHFLNYEHARIHLNKELSLSDESPLSETINQSIDKFLKICTHTAKLKDFKPSNDLSASLLLDKISPTLETKEGFDLFLEGLGMLIEEVRRPYLQDGFIDIEQRGEVYKAVSRAFTLFNDFVTENSKNQVARTILETLNSNLATTLEVKRESLVKQYQGLSIKLEGNVFFTKLLGEIEKISNNLGREDSEVRDQLISFLEQAKGLESSKPRVIREFIKKHIASLDEKENSQDVKSELAKNSLKLAKLLMDEAIDDSLNYDVDSLIKEVIKSNNQLEKFREALPDFKTLYGKMPYDKWDFELKEKRDHLVHLAAQYIVREGLDLEEPLIEGLFIENKALYLYKEIAGLAIGLGAKNPLIFDLTEVTKQKQEFTKQIDGLNEQLDNLTKKQEQLTKKLSTSAEAHELKVKQLTEEHESVTKELTQTKEDHELAVKKLRDANEVQKQDFAEKAVDLKKRLVDLARDKEHLAEQLSQGEREHGRQVEELTHEKDSLSKQLETLRKEHAVVVQKLTTANEIQEQEFAKKVEDLEKQLTGLTKGQESLTEKLDQKEKEHAKAVEELTFAKEEQRQEFSAKVERLEEQVIKLTKEQEQLTEKLSTGEEAHELTVKQLTQQYDSVTKELAQTKEDHKLAVQKLSEVNEAQKQDFVDKAERLEKRLDELTQDKERLAAQLSKNEREHGRQVEELTHEKDSLSKQLETLRKEHAVVVQKLTTANEIQEQEFAKKVEDLEKQLTGLTKGQESLTEKLDQKEKEHAKAVEELTLAKEVQRQEFTKQIDGLNEQLDNLTKKQEQLTKKLSTSAEAHELKVKQLTEEHESITKELTQTKEDHELAVKKLRDANEVQKQDFAEKAVDLKKRLVDLARDKEHLAEQLSQGEREHGRQVEELTQEKDSLGKQLETLKKEHVLVMQKPTTPNEVQEQEFAKKVEGLENQLAGLTKGQESLTEQLNSSKIEHQRAIEKLTQEKDNLADENARLHQENMFLQDDIELLRQKKENLHGILNNNTEWKCQSIIIDKLTPLTKDYLLHLAAEIQKSIAPTLDVKDVLGFITQVNRIQNWPQDKASKILKEKFDAVSGLYRTLHDEAILKPSEKITKFYVQLNDANEVLKKHRDPNWQNFANAAVVVGIVLTGVLPGLAVLGIMALWGKSPKFWESAGHTFFTASKEEIADKLPEAIMKNGITSGGS